MKKITSFFVSLLCTLSIVFAQSSYIDTSFGVDGVSNYKIAEYLEADGPLNMDITDSGKILKIGLASNENDESLNIINQFNSNGALDLNFGNNGILELNDFIGYDIISKNNDIYISGTSTINGNIGILKLDSAGNKVSSFGNNGVALIDKFALGMTIKIDSNGKFIVAGRHINIDTEEEQLLMTRFNSNGTIDNAFGTNGALQVNISDVVDNEELYDINLELFDNNSLLVTGTVYTPENGTPTGEYEYNEFALKANSNGVLDTSFGSNGFSIYYDLTARSANIFDSYILSNNKILITIDGFDDSGFTGEPIQGLLRLNSDGSIDNTFGSNGLLTIYNENFYILDLFDSNLDDDIFILGDGNDENNNWHILILKVNENGIIDNTFGENGILSLDFPDYDEIEYITNGEELADGKILVSGFNNDNNGYILGRFFKENQLNVSDKALNTVALYPNPVRNEINIKSTQAINHLQIYQMDGKLVYNQYLNTNLADVSLLKAGLYIVKAFSGNKVETFKINKL
ncbi:T9SS type A sorting domain-containing protein [Algibacter pectinivorans]|uniref:Delta-60 repeat domain-containing protein/Por secretion system C-terminal sorting domain-containing protein n=1 Tax=Algibacter pectinivorans TaxID=870482 RepID=A0A1I1P867_9FLAO|nr:T9SS type A sorting domain-containing protein [Algibacter pectinivorans]SFD06017.1 delta-60 repeat domain-containing protein/Por secretion system C-terminal sorting domain-containing protein [Algibacter pectinivorans]